jgi:hypothetical protein
MTDNASHPFRSQALQRYRERRERAELPRFVSPRVFGILWLLLALLVIATALSWFARVPTYATGAVVVTEPTGADGQPALMALLPPELLPRLRPGGTVLVRLESGVRARSEIREVDAQPQSPAAVRRRFALDDETARMVHGPVVVATLDAARLHSDQSLVHHTGAVYRGEVEAGSCRLLALVPVLGPGCSKGSASPVHAASAASEMRSPEAGDDWGRLPRETNKEDRARAAPATADGG